MSGVALRFYGLGVVSVLIGMTWGIIMAATQDHSLLSAHAHLNLIGWVSFALMGLFYHLVPRAASSRLAGVHFVLAALGLVTIVPGIALAVTGRGEGLAIAGSFITLAAMLLFAWIVWSCGRRPA